jgi:hypothetical protein
MWPEGFPRRSPCARNFHNSLEASLADDTQDMPIYDAERERLIRELAYQLWVSEGRPEGREEEYWHRARERMEAETQSSYPPTQSRSDRT